MARTNNRLILDLVKDATSESNSIVDLTPYFQGRVGDSNATFPMGLTWAGRVKSLTGYNVNFKGTDSQGLAFNITNGAKDSGPGDDFGIGRFTWTFPAQTFQNPGEWSTACFYVTKDSTNEIVSTLDVHLNVFQSDVSMDTLIGSYDNRAENLLDEFVSYLADKKSDTEKAVAGFQNNFSTMFAEYEQIKQLDQAIKDMAAKNQYIGVAQLSQDRLDDQTGAVPTPATYANGGAYLVHHSYTTLAKAGITPGTTVSSSQCDDIVYLRTIVLNGGRVIQYATVTDSDSTWTLTRRNQNTTAWQAWHVVTQFYA